MRQNGLLSVIVRGTKKHDKSTETIDSSMDNNSPSEIQETQPKSFLSLWSIFQIQ